MKKLILSLTLLILLFPSIKIGAQGLLKINNPIKIMTYNIRFDNPLDNDNVWANRKDRVASVIRFREVDIFCLQEALKNQVDDLQNTFPNFAYCGVGREDGAEKGEYNPIFYDKRRFAVAETGTFWLSETPEKPGSIGWFATAPRIVTWAKMSDLSNGREFFVFNTHFAHSSKNARNESASLLLSKITKFVDDQAVVITGDLNDRPNSGTYKLITNNKTEDIIFYDARFVSKYPHHGPTFTFIGFDFIGVPGRIIDFIFVNGKIEVIQHAILTDNWDGVYPSDHLPVFIEMELK